MITANIFLILISLALGLSLPLIGTFVILRREALLADALSHVILLGIALAVVFKINVLFGILAFALLAATGLYFIRNKSALTSDAVVGVFFTTSLAIASLLIPSEGLLEAFLGDLSQISRGDVIVSLFLAATVVIILLAKFREFAFVSFAPDLAWVDKLNTKKYEFAFVLLLALGVATGIQLVGALLVSALIIIPAATAKIFSRQIRSMAIGSMAFGLLTVLAGLVITSAKSWQPGPTIILTGSVIFFLVFLANSIFKKHS